MTNKKKDFQKAIATIRNDLNKERQFGRNYPKAMMTAQQERKNTATVNCAISKSNLSAVLEHSAFAEFLSKHPAEVRVESNRISGYTDKYEYHVRLIFKNQ